MTSQSDDEGVQTLTEWIQGMLFEELCSMPLWTLAAFGFLSDGDRLKNSDIRLSLIRYLCSKHKEKAPDDLLEREAPLKIVDFLPVCKAAIQQCTIILRRVEDESSAFDAPPPST